MRHLKAEDYTAMNAANLARSYKSAEQGAATTVWAAVSKHFEDVGNGGRYLADVGECGPATEDADIAAAGYYGHAYDEEREERLWRITCERLGVLAGE